MSRDSGNEMTFPGVIGSFVQLIICVTYHTQTTWNLFGSFSFSICVIILSFCLVYFCFSYILYIYFLLFLMVLARSYRSTFRTSILIKSISCYSVIINIFIRKISSICVSCTFFILVLSSKRLLESFLWK